jgi:hypothetical protein
VANTGGIKGSFGRRIGRQLIRAPIVRLLSQLYKRSSNSIPSSPFNRITQRDNASKYIMSVFEAIRITPIFWPANSPDLNPIETI